jgi:hypothetical protein
MSVGNGPPFRLSASAYDLLLAAVPVPAAAGLLVGDAASYVGALASLVLVCYGLFVSPPTTGRSG